MDGPPRDTDAPATLALAVDIGGTKVEAALVTDAGLVLDHSRHRAPTGRDRSLDEIARAVREVALSALGSAPERTVAGIGIGSAGPVDLVSRSISPLNLPKAAGLPVVDVLSGIAPELGIRLALDGTCIALAEHEFGAARGAQNALAMVVSTGIGGGLVIDGSPVTGRSGNAGHIGQIRLRERPDGSPALVGTLEAIASGPSTVAWARQNGWSGDSGEQLAASYADDEPIAVRAVLRSASAVGEAIASVATLLDLDVAVIAGGFSNVAADYIDLVQASVDENAAFDYVRRVRVVPTGLGSDGPLIGAATLVLR